MSEDASIFADPMPAQPAVALLCIDLQRGDCTAALTPAAKRAAKAAYHTRVRTVVLPNTRRLQAAFRARRLEVLHVRIRALTRDGRDRSRLHKALGILYSPAQAAFCDGVGPRGDEVVLEKTASGCFTTTRIDLVLRNLGVSSLVVLGTRTNECVEASVRAASDLGYHVSVVDDACATLSMTEHEVALGALAPYAKRTTTAHVLAQLAQLPIVAPTPAAHPSVTADELDSAPTSLDAVTTVTTRGERVHALLQSELGAIGRAPGGGVTRLAFSNADIEARQWLTDIAQREFGADSVRVDAAGNIIALFKGASASTIWLGSHIDTVRNGGNFDGCFGVVGALEAVRAARAQHKFQHSLAVVAFADEEGTMIGSRAFAGQPISPSDLGALPREVLDELAADDAADHTRAWRAALARVGGDLAKLGDAAVDVDSSRAYVEMHIEQGPVLVESGVELGIVSAIVGLRNFQCSFTGKASHAGATQMIDRADASVAAAKFLLEVNFIANEMACTDDSVVATVGRFNVQPNQPSAVPGRVDVSVDMRASTVEALDELQERISDAATQAAAETPRCATSGLELHHKTAPVACDRALMRQLRAASNKLGQSSQVMLSRAGHDAQNVAQRLPMAMLFVPSETKVSHSPDEFSTVQQLQTGTDTLASALIGIDNGN